MFGRKMRRLSDHKSSLNRQRKHVSRKMLVKALAVALQITELAIKLIELIGKIVGGLR